MSLNRPENPRVLLVAPSLRIMGGQAVMADRLVRAMRDDGVQIDFLPINPQPPGILRYAERIKYLRTLVVSSFYIASLISRVPRYDVIHLFSASYLSFIVSQLPAILVARLYGKPLILNYHSGEAEDHLQRWGRVVFAILRLTDRIVVPSRFLVEVFERFGFEATAIPNLADYSAIRYRHRGSGARPRIVVPRALEPLYNVACAIKAFEIVQGRIPSAELTILGKGSQRRYLEQLVRERRLQGVDFTGRVEREDIGAIYDEHDICLNSSSIDNTPVSLLEAFAAGLPVVTTNAGGIPFLVQDRITGHVVDVDDHAGLAARMLELLDDPSQVSRLSRAGREETNKYQWRAIAPQWYELYRNTVSRPAGRSPDSYSSGTFGSPTDTLAESSHTPATSQSTACPTETHRTS